MGIVATAAAAAEPFTNPILPGDYCDPTILRVGGEYYMTNTSAVWAPSLRPGVFSAGPGEVKFRNFVYRPLAANSSLK